MWICECAVCHLMPVNISYYPKKKKSKSKKQIKFKFKSKIFQKFSWVSVKSHKNPWFSRVKEMGLPSEMGNPSKF